MKQILLFLCLLFSYYNAIAATSCNFSFELSTKDHHIIDQCGNRVTLKSVNWFGFNEPPQVAGGLNKQSLQHIVNLIKRGGFNSIRLTYSNEMLHSKRLVELKDVSANPELANKFPLEVMDIVIKALTDAGLVVILNDHTTLSQWPQGFDMNGLWHHSSYQTTAEWLNDWVMLVNRYRDNPLVAGVDLRNEVRTARYRHTWLPVFPNWGNGDENDWKLAATQAANLIHEINPHLLMVIEGINWTGLPLFQGYRPLLIPIRQDPVILNIPNKLVYEVHVYGYTGPEHTVEKFSSMGKMRYREMNEDLLRSTLDKEFGYVLEPEQPYTAPIWLGEFGVGSQHATQADILWFQHIIRYVTNKEMSWALWPLNPERADGIIEDSINDFGLVKDDWSDYREDWRSQWIRKLVSAN